MSVIFFIKTTFKLDLNHILNCVNKCDFGTKCFAKVEHFVLRLIVVHRGEFRKYLPGPHTGCGGIEILPSLFREIREGEEVHQFRQQRWRP